jgi:hypothetical protein
VPLDESQVSVGGLLSLGYGSKQRSRKKRQNVNYVEDTVTVTGSKRAKDQKIWSEVRERKSLDKEIEDDISARKKDRGQLSKRKNPSLDVLEHHARREER